MEFLTAGQVVDKMKIGYYAIKVDGEYGDVGNNYRLIDSVLYVDENDYLLKTINNENPVVLVYPPNKKQDKYIVVNEEEYKRIKGSMNKE